MIIYIVQGEHHIVPGCRVTAHFTRAGADEAAADLCRFILKDIDPEKVDEDEVGPMPKDVTAANWEAAADWLQSLNEQGDGIECDVWLTEVTPTDGPASPSADYLARFPEDQRETADRAYQDGFADGGNAAETEGEAVRQAGLKMLMEVTASWSRADLDDQAHGVGVAVDALSEALGLDLPVDAEDAAAMAFEAWKAAAAGQGQTPLEVARGLLQECTGAMASAEDQISQMKGMFSDEDGTIADAEDALQDAGRRALAFLKGEPVPESNFTHDDDSED